MIRSSRPKQRRSECLEAGKSASKYSNNNNEHLETGSYSSRARHPPHLKGREIGLFYARRNKERAGEKSEISPKSKIDTKKLPSLALNENIESAFCEFFSLLQSTGDYVHASHLEEVPQSVPCSISSTLTQVKDSQTELQFQNNSCCLSQVKSLDQKLYHNFCYRNQNSPLLEFRKKLPAYQKQNDILSAINDNQVVLIIGETGCGKTTQVPQFILDSFIKCKEGSLCKVVCTQPRRISAVTVAERIAEERGTVCGEDEVGYQIRLQSRLPAEQGSILFCTVGILLQWLHGDPYLKNASHIIVDEVHERDLLTDFLLVILRDILEVRRDLKLIMMSATLNFEHISEYFGGCPTISIKGFTFPVEVIMLEDIIEETKYVPHKVQPEKPKWVTAKDKKKVKEIKMNDAVEEARYLQYLRKNYSSRTVEVLRQWNQEDIDLDLIVCVIENIMSKGKEGAILVFLPGWQQISKLKILLSKDKYFCSHCLIVPLHSLMPTINQREAFQKPPNGKRKVILATNIAETSITIDDVVFVIDSGKIKMTNFDPEMNLSTLKAEWIATSNAKQRTGRAGRTQSGTCFRLFTQYQEQKLENYQIPEMLRTRLEETILKIKILKLGNAEDFLQKALDPPSTNTIKVSLNLLKKLKALDFQENLAPLGYHLAKLPMDPQTGKMCILGAIFSCLDPILSIAASLSFREAFVIPLGLEKKVDEIKRQLSRNTNSDHLMMHFVLQGWEEARNKGRELDYCYSNYLSKSTLRMLGDLKQQIAENLCQLKFLHTADLKHPDYNRNSHNVSLLKAVICSGLYPNVGKLIRGNGRKQHKVIPLVKALDSDGSRVTLHPKSVNSQETFFYDDLLVYHLKVKSTQTYLHDSTIMNYIPLILFGETFCMESINDVRILCIDHWFKIKCSSSTVSFLKEVREVLNFFLRRIFRTPLLSSSANWEKFSQLIIALLSDDMNLIPHSVQF